MSPGNRIVFQNDSVVPYPLKILCVMFSEQNKQSWRESADPIVTSPFSDERFFLLSFCCFEIIFAFAGAPIRNDTEYFSTSSRVVLGQKVLRTITQAPVYRQGVIPTAWQPPRWNHGVM